MTKLSADDRLDLMDLCARYYICIDDKDADGFMRCWADDDDIVYESEFGNIKGRKAMLEFFDNHVNHGMGVGKRHLLGNVIIREGEDVNTAYTTIYMFVIEVDDSPQVIATAILRDSKSVRTADGWQFKHRKMELDKGYWAWLALHPEAQPA